MSKPAIGYWNVRGLAEGILYLLNYTKTDYELVEYVTGDGPDYNKDGWLSVKEKLGLPFPNLPYYVEGDLKFTQSLAIMRHIASKHDLCGKTVEQRAFCDCLSLESLDFILGFVKATYFCQNFDEDIKVYLKNIRTNVKRFANYLGEKPYMTGQDITFADFMFWEAMDQLRTLDPTVFDEHPNLKNYMKRIAELPGMKEYLSFQESSARPISNKMAKWGTKFIARPSN
ncbi:glutathione S-transferase Mu 2-like [Actinia tenebrosa]|uniref:glutathione transferase n=1 Tax=Actinia tenebrosa TaxID=6105 RepID=A0A6P8IZ88_ACTTE|nr:glutathione S-transferase Mu 2-like [Actinia tenebrosa]